MAVFETETKVKLELVKIRNTNALQSLMADAGIFGRVAGRQPDPSELLGVVRNWNKLFAYAVMNGVANEPDEADIEELEAIGMTAKSKNVTKLNWIRYGKSNGLDILTTQQEAANLVMAIIENSFEQEEPQQAPVDDDEDDD